MINDRFHTLYKFIENNHKQNKRGYNCLLSLNKLNDWFTKKIFLQQLINDNITITRWDNGNNLFNEFLIMFPSMFEIKENELIKEENIINYKTYKLDKNKHKLVCKSVLNSLNNFQMKPNEEMQNCIERRYIEINILLRIFEENQI